MEATGPAKLQILFFRVLVYGIACCVEPVRLSTNWAILHYCHLRYVLHQIHIILKG